jgi:hypothetical protein
MYHLRPLEYGINELKIILAVSICTVRPTLCAECDYVFLATGRIRSEVVNMDRASKFGFFRITILCEYP